MRTRTPRVDAIALNRDLEFVATEVVNKRYPALKARMAIPIDNRIPEWAQSYVWREQDVTGEAAFIFGNGKDAPRVDISRTENYRTIKRLGGAYAYTEDEIITAQKMGVSLETDRATGVRDMIERKLDKVLALGDADYGLQGLLTLDGVAGIRSYTAMDKAGGSGPNLKLWGTLAAPLANADEVAADLAGFATYMYEQNEEVWDRFAMVLPAAAYGYASQIRLGDTTTTALQYALATCPHIESIMPWNRCKTAGTGGTQRACAYAKDPSLNLGIISQEFTPRPVERNGLEYSVLCTAKTGGFLTKAPCTVGYMDSF